MSKKVDGDVMSGNCNVIVIFPIDGLIGTNRRSESGPTFCKTCIFVNSNLLSCKN